MLFVASGLFHVGVWWTAGMPTLEGPVSWRKPITFGFSTGVLSLSISWVLGLLPQTPRLVRQAWAFSLLLIAEIALIDMQQWRGVASHFNNATAFDGAVFSLMGALIMSVAVLIAIWTVALFRPAASAVRAMHAGAVDAERADRTSTSPELLWAARAGMVLLNAGNIIGLIMAASEMTALKPVHGAALHAIQVFPLMVWLAARLGYPRAWRDTSRSWHSPS